MITADKYRENARVTAVLMEAGIALMRQNLRRRNPSVSEAEVDALLASWLHRTEEPLAGDTAGAVRHRKLAS